MPRALLPRAESKLKQAPVHVLLRGLVLAALISLPLIGSAASANLASITDFGAVGDGLTLNTEAIQRAVDQLASKGGGTLAVPKGVFRSGAIFLKPGVNLQLEEGAVLQGSSDRKDYPIGRTRIEGHFEEWLPALVNADHCDHLSITGPGVLDGNGAPFWAEFLERRAANSKTTNLDVPRPRLAFIQNSDDVQISAVNFRNTAFWNLHLYMCKNVTVQSCLFETPERVRCPSSDGCDLDSCQSVTIRSCTFRVDDDCVCLKGTKGPFALEDKESLPVEHIRVSACAFERGHGVLTLGSEATVVRDVVVENCKVGGSINLVRLKLRPDTPQLYEDIHYRGIALDGEGTIFEVQPWKQYFDLKGQPPPHSIVRNLTASNIHGRYGAFGTLAGNPGQTEIRDITLDNIDVQLTNDELEAVDVTNLQIEKVMVNGQPLVVKKK